MDIQAIIDDFDLNDDELMMLQDILTQDEIDEIEW